MIYPCLFVPTILALYPQDLCPYLLKFPWIYLWTYRSLQPRIFPIIGRLYWYPYLIVNFSFTLRPSSTIPLNLIFSLATIIALIYASATILTAQATISTRNGRYFYPNIFFKFDVSFSSASITLNSPHHHSLHYHYYYYCPPRPISSLQALKAVPFQAWGPRKFHTFRLSINSPRCKLNSCRIQAIFFLIYIL